MKGLIDFINIREYYFNVVVFRRKMFIPRRLVRKIDF